MKMCVSLTVFLMAVSVSMPCHSQDTIQVDGITVKPNTEFKLTKLELTPTEHLDSPLEPSTYTMIFNSLIPKSGVRFYLYPFVAVQNGNAYDIRDNIDSIGVFFETIDTKEKVRDLLYWRKWMRGGIINSPQLYDKIVEELLKINPEWVMERKTPFNGFEVEEINDKYYLAKYLYEHGTIRAEKCLVDHDGHVTLVESKICTKGPYAMPGALTISPDSDGSKYGFAIRRAIDSFPEDKKSPKTDKNQRLFYYIHYRPGTGP